jgi:transcriptional regulator with XRE-family HTH domain
LTDDIHTEAQLRAERIKKVRNLANLTRKQMCERSSIKPQTLIGWEVARHGGLSKTGAKKVIECVAKEGVVCTFEWLFDGVGQGPTVIPDYQNFSSLTTPSTDEGQAPRDDHANIIEELRVFKQHFTNSTELQISDDSMLPMFEKGDYVAGVKYYHAEISQQINKICIVQLDTGLSLLRVLKLGKDSDRYTLVCTNYQTSVTDPIIHNVKVISAAPIIWHRKLVSHN